MPVYELRVQHHVLSADAVHCRQIGVGMDPMPDEGSYLEIWKRQADGSWRVAMDVFNSDLPAPE